MDLVRRLDRGPHLDDRRDLHAIEPSLHLWRGVPGHPRRRRDRDGPGMLQLRGPLRRRRRCPERGPSLHPSRCRGDAVPRQGGQEGIPRGGRGRRRRHTGDHHAPGGRCMHLLEPAGLPSRRGMLTPHRGCPGRRAPPRLEAQRLLAGTDPTRALHRRRGSCHLAPAGVETPRLGRGRARVPLVVHRGHRGLQRRRARLPGITGRDRRTRRRRGLRPDGRPPRASLVGSGGASDAASGRRRSGLT